MKFLFTAIITGTAKTPEKEQVELTTMGIEIDSYDIDTAEKADKEARTAITESEILKYLDKRANVTNITTSLAITKIIKN